MGQATRHGPMAYTLFVWTYEQNQQPSSSVFFSHNKPANSTFSTINQRNEQGVSESNLMKDSALFHQRQAMLGTAPPSVHHQHYSISIRWL
jgi:hypothetical protein